MICPACEATNVDMEHLEDCGVVTDWTCVCGETFDTERDCSIQRDFLDHCKEVRHEWKKLLTRKTLEGF